MLYILSLTRPTFKKLENKNPYLIKYIYINLSTKLYTGTYKV